MAIITQSCTTLPTGSIDYAGLVITAGYSPNAPQNETCYRMFLLSYYIIYLYVYVYTSHNTYTEFSFVFSTNKSRVYFEYGPQQKSFLFSTLFVCWRLRSVVYGFYCMCCMSIYLTQRLISSFL